MCMYSLTAIVEGFDLDDEFQNAGLERLEFDAVAGRTAGVTSVDADIEAASPADAVLRLHVALRTINTFIRRIDLDLVTVAEIAERIDKSRETVRLWTTGARRADFPDHFGHVGESLVWAWADVYQWLRDAAIVGDAEPEPIPVDVVEGMNGAFAQIRSRWADGWLKPANHGTAVPPVKVAATGVAEANKNPWVEYGRAA